MTTSSKLLWDMSNLSLRFERFWYFRSSKVLIRSWHLPEYVMPVSWYELSYHRMTASKASTDRVKTGYNEFFHMGCWHSPILWAHYKIATGPNRTEALDDSAVWHELGYTEGATAANACRGCVLPGNRWSGETWECSSLGVGCITPSTNQSLTSWCSSDLSTMANQKR